VVSRAVVIVAHEGDELADAFERACWRRGHRPLRVDARRLCDRRVRLAAGELAVDGRAVAAVLFRVQPDDSVSVGFADADRPFADRETIAVWLAGAKLPGVIAFNGYDAEAWFRGLGWVVWRERLLEAGVPVTPARFGDGPERGSSVWRPYRVGGERAAPTAATRRALGTASCPAGPRRRHLAVGGGLVAGQVSRTAERAAVTLAAGGIALAEIATDDEDRVVTVDPHPLLATDEAALAAARLAALLR
jgi:hypothetical protein